MQINELKKEYQDGSKLNQRLNLHDRFSINKIGWYAWVFDQFEWSFNCHILELGCGSGQLWLRNLPGISNGWHITLSDFSPGMLAEAQHNLRDATKDFNFKVIDAQSIPLEDESMDAVIANHMLYHVPDRRKAYAEIRRVLKPPGQLYAATNGQFTMKQYDELVIKFAPTNKKKRFNRNKAYPNNYFVLENGYNELAEWFSKVAVKYYEDALVVTEAEPLVAYVVSSGQLRGEALLKFRWHVEELIEKAGFIHIDKIAGVLVATKKAA